MTNARYRRHGAPAGTVVGGRAAGPAVWADLSVVGSPCPEPRPLAGGSSPPGLLSFSMRRLPDRDREFGPIALFRAADGTRVAEVDLTSDHDHAVAELITHARALGAEKLWVHAHVIDAGLGFTRRGSPSRTCAERPPAPVELASPPLGLVQEIQRACFAGVWGHHDPGVPDPEGVFVGLHEGGAWVGICEVDPDAQWIDGPGVMPGRRTPDRYARLVRGAAAYLRSEPVQLETWGDFASTLSTYAALGFEVVHSVSGWELDLGA